MSVHERKADTEDDGYAKGTEGNTENWRVGDETGEVSNQYQNGGHNRVCGKQEGDVKHHVVHGKVLRAQVVGDGSAGDIDECHVDHAQDVIHI